MIDKTKVSELVLSKLDDQMFVVDISVSKSNKITVLVDSFAGLTIDNCVDISRHIEQNLDRETEDYELEVSSPGLTENFRVVQQYKKNVGNEVEVALKSGQVIKGSLKSAGDDEIVLLAKHKGIAEGEKKKSWIFTENRILYSEIKSAKAVITF